MTTPDQQVGIIMKELSKHGNQGRAAAEAGVCRQTAARYLQAGKLPSELKKAHDGRGGKIRLRRCGRRSRRG
jgi:hypothetical protein